MSTCGGAHGWGYGKFKRRHCGRCIDVFNALDDALNRAPAANLFCYTQQEVYVFPLRTTGVSYHSWGVVSFLCSNNAKRFARTSSAVEAALDDAPTREPLDFFVAAMAPFDGSSSNFGSYTSMARRIV
mmetsp:Transcript_1364/g.4946  ORF Transcript_1364/g.4946 Transcript_1364/m.4946 type:complete len:128 (-) Transcript_1364:913-1296(-)